MSYANVVLYSSVLPSFNPKKKDEEKIDRNQKTIKADDPQNKDEVRHFFETCE